MHWRRCSKHCAVPRTLPSSSNTGLLVFLVVFALGAVFFAIGTLLVRIQPPHATSEISELQVDLETRLDMIERLALVGQPWCVEELVSLLRAERDPLVRDAAEAALVVIHAR